jgi:hypothetical protein
MERKKEELERIQSGFNRLQEFYLDKLRSESVLSLTRNTSLNNSLVNLSSSEQLFKSKMNPSKRVINETTA